MAYNQSIGFGSGVMYMTPASGVVTPIRIGILQDVSFNMSFDEKPLYGQNQWAIAIGRGKAKGEIKAKFAQIDSGAIGQVFLGITPTAGQEVIQDLEAKAVPASPSYTVQTTNHSSFTQDLGVFYATTGQPLKQVAAGQEAAGAYSVATTGGSKGTYTFSANDASAAVLISYAWNDGAAGFKSTLSNSLMGTTTYFQTDLFQSNPEVAGAQWGMRLYRCTSSKLNFASKQDDWMIPEFDAAIQANAAGKVLDFNTPV